MNRPIGEARNVCRSNGTTWFYIEREGLQLFHSGVGHVGVVSWRQIEQAKAALEQEHVARRERVEAHDAGRERAHLLPCHRLELTPHPPRDEWAEECDKRGMLWRESERQLAAANRALVWFDDQIISGCDGRPPFVNDAVAAARAAEGSK